MRERVDRRLGIRSMLRALTSVERTALDVAPSFSASRAYRCFDHMLVAERAMPSFFSRMNTGGFPEPVLRAAGLRPWRLRALFPFLPRLRVSSVADAILVTSNLRAFYTSRQVTLKLANPALKNSAERIALERSIRTGLVPGDGVRVPELSPVPFDPEAGFVVEELLDARPIDPSEFSAAEIARRLLAFFIANRLEMRPLGDVVCFSRDWRALAAYCESAGIAVPPVVQQAVTALLSDTSLAARLVPCAMCHFDLSVSNLMRSDDTLFIIDWEWAERSMIFVDAILLSMQIREFANCFIKQLESLEAAACPEMLDTESQFLVAAVHVGSKRVARHTVYVVGRNASRCEWKLKHRISGILDVCASRLRERQKTVGLSGMKRCGGDGPDFRDGQHAPAGRPAAPTLS